MEPHTVKKLSKAVLELKFMKKSKQKALEEEDEEERQRLYEHQLNFLEGKSDTIIMLDSYIDCEKFLPCRLSFGGMEPDIEKLNEDRLTGLYKIEKTEEADDGNMEADITNEEIAYFYSGKKCFSKLNKRNSDNLGSNNKKKLKAS